MPIGDYTRTVLESMGMTDVLDNVVSNEEDVKGVVGKITSGAADAGFVYVTDATAAGDAVEAIELPEEAQAVVQYPIAVVVDSENAEAAQEFVDLVLARTARKRSRKLASGHREAGLRRRPGDRGRTHARVPPPPRSRTLLSHLAQ